MKEIISAAILLLTGIVAFVISFRSFREKGFLFNNAYLYASKQERDCMDKKPHYRQSAIVFLLAGIALLFSGFGVLFDSGWIFYIAVGILVAAMIYAIVSGIRIEIKGKA